MIGGVELAGTAGQSYVHLLALQPHTSALTVSAAQLLEEAPWGEFAAGALPVAIEERMGRKSDGSNVGSFVEGLFNNGSRQERLALRAIAGSLWAAERLRKLNPEFEKEGLLGFPGRDGEKVWQILQNSTTGFLLDEELRDRLEELAEEEELALSNKNLGDWWRRRGVRQMMKEALLAELEGKRNYADALWSRVAFTLEEGQNGRDSLLAAALYLKGRLNAEKAAHLFAEGGYPLHAALAWYKAADYFDGSPDFFLAAARTLRDRICLTTESPEPDLKTDTMTTLYRRSVEAYSDPTKGLLFAEVQEAYGYHYYIGQHAGLNLRFFLGALHLFEAASVFALHDSRSGRHGRNAFGAVPDGEWALDAALAAMNGQVLAWKNIVLG